MASTAWPRHGHPPAERPGLEPGTGSSSSSMSSSMPPGEDQDNQTMFQGFEWYVPADHKHWCRLEAALPSLERLGITSMWIPPACKASWHTGNGYDLYDLYDLGEFAQKGATHTKWGTKEELRRLVEQANRHGVRVLFDAVLNHKAAADHSEHLVATKVDPKSESILIFIYIYFVQQSWVGR